MRHTTDRFEALDGLRGIAAVMVAALHAREIAGFGGVATEWLATPGAYLLVDFFFVLSGFVLAAAYGNRIADGADAGRFMVRRVGRLMPLHLAMLAAIGVIVACVGADRLGAELASAGLPITFDLASAAAHIGLVQTFDVAPLLSWNYAAWSISVEMWTNLLFALLLSVAPRGARIWTLALGLICLALIAYATDDAILRASSFGRCVAGFMLGSAVWFWGLHKLAARLPAHRAELGVAALVVALILFGAESALSYTAPLLFALATAILAGERGIVSYALRAKPFQRLGAWSYSIYLVHVPVLFAAIGGTSVTGHSLIGLAQGSPLLAEILMLTFLAAVIVIARLTFTTIEEPGRRAASAWVANGKRRGSTPTIARATHLNAARV